MSLSAQRSVVESFKCNDKHVRSVYVKDVGQCLVSKDVYEAIGYGKEDGVKAIQRLVPEKYKIWFGDAQVDLEGVDNSVYTQPNTTLLKQPGLYCFLLRCKRIEAEPFMEWVVETVLPYDVWRLSRQLSNQEKETEEKDTVIALMNDDLQDRDNQIQDIQYENVTLQSKRYVYKEQLQKCQHTLCRSCESCSKPSRNKATGYRSSSMRT